MQLIGILAGEDKENEEQAIFKDKMNGNFLELMNNMSFQIKEAHRLPKRINKSIPAHFIIKPKNTEDKEMIKSREKRLPVK